MEHRDTLPVRADIGWPRARFWLRHGLLPLLGFAAVATVFELSDLDLFVSDQLYDFAGGRWPHQEAWWANELIHVAGRWFVGALGLSALSVSILSLFLTRLKGWGRRTLYLFLVIGLATGGVKMMQSRSSIFCPRAIERYGGSAPRIALFEPAREGLEPGRCFPSKHASAGFSLFALYFFFRGQDRRRALAGLLLGLVVGSVFSYGQMARGAHFLSHNVWSAAICWTLALGLYALMFRSETRSPLNG